MGVASRTDPGSMPRSPTTGTGLRGPPEMVNTLSMGKLITLVIYTGHGCGCKGGVTSAIHHRIKTHLSLPSAACMRQ